MKRALKKVIDPAQIINTAMDAKEYYDQGKEIKDATHHAAMAIQSHPRINPQAREAAKRDSSGIASKKPKKLIPGATTINRIAGGVARVTAPGSVSNPVKNIARRAVNAIGGGIRQVAGFGRSLSAMEKPFPFAIWPNGMNNQ